MISESNGEEKCALCGDKGRQTSKYGNLGEIECAYFLKHLGESLSDGALVCRKHLVEAKRHGENQEHVSSWKIVAAGNVDSSLNSHHSVKKCSNLQCENVVPDKLIQPLFTTTRRIFQTQGTGEPFVLYRQCYNKAYTISCDILDYHAALVELTLKAVQTFVGTAQML